MANIQQEVLAVLLRRLLVSGLIDQTTHDNAVAAVNASIGFPDFFDLPEEDEPRGII